MPEYSLNPLQDDCYENSTVLKNKFNIHDDEKLDIMDSVFTINKYYTYGTRLNIEGTIDDKLNYSLVLYNGEFIRVPLILKENTFVLSEYINDG